MDVEQTMRVVGVSEVIVHETCGRVFNAISQTSEEMQCFDFVSF